MSCATTDNTVMMNCGEALDHTVMFADHVGVSGTPVQVIKEEYSASVRKYIVRRRAPHNSPDVSFLGPKLGRIFSLFDLVLLMMIFLFSLTFIVHCLEDYFTTSGFFDHPTKSSMLPSASNAMVPSGSSFPPTETPSLSSGASASSDPHLDVIRGILEGVQSEGESTINHVVHFLTSVVPWFVLSRLEVIIALVLSVLPKQSATTSTSSTPSVHTFSSVLSESLLQTAPVLSSTSNGSGVGTAALRDNGNYNSIEAQSGWLVNAVHPAVFWAAAITLFMIVKIPMRLSKVAEEEVFVVQGVGLQITKRNFLGSVVAQRFIDVSLIRSIFIHEGFFRHRVIFFLAILVENKSDLEVLFEESLPRLAVLRPTLNGIRAVLYPSKKEFGPSLADIANGKALLSTAGASVGGGGISGGGVSGVRPPVLIDSGAVGGSGGAGGHHHGTFPSVSPHVRTHSEIL